MTRLAFPRFLHAGESALVVEYGDTIDPEIHDRVLALDRAIADAAIPGILETVPTYRSLMVNYDPERLERSEEHTSELQSRLHLVCRLLLEKKKQQKTPTPHPRQQPPMRCKDT